MRDRLAADVGSVAQIMKQFVRQPGEGAWSDRDQAALERLAGSITEARSLTEVRRRLQAVKERIENAFGVDTIQFDSGLSDTEAVGGGGGSTMAPSRREQFKDLD